MKPQEVLKFYCPKCKKVIGSGVYWLNKKDKNICWCKWCGKIIFVQEETRSVRL